MKIQNINFITWILIDCLILEFGILLHCISVSISSKKQLICWNMRPSKWGPSLWCWISNHRNSLCCYFKWKKILSTTHTNYSICTREMQSVSPLHPQNGKQKNKAAFEFKYKCITKMNMRLYSLAAYLKMSIINKLDLFIVCTWTFAKRAFSNIVLNQLLMSVKNPLFYFLIKNHAKHMFVL